MYTQRAARYYDAASRLRAADIRVSSSGFTPTPRDYYQSPPSFEEYRYDALGRRVLRRARELAGAATSSYTGQIQRFIWDGAQLIAEVQYPGADSLTATDLERDTESLTTDETAYYGRVIYLPGEVIDRPVSITRMWWSGASDPLAMSPRWDTQNRGYDHAFYGPGAICPTCLVWHWPHRQAYGMSISADPRLSYFEYDKWWGSLVQDQMDATADLYKRNRYYDPNTGRFTQEDPVGLAGGLNLYGFADGDPVNFGDPFGLAPCSASRAWTECIAQAIANWGAKNGGIGGWLALNGGAALNGGLEAFGLNAAADAGDRIGSGELFSGTAGAALTLIPGSRQGKGLARLVIGKLDDLGRAGALTRGEVRLALQDLGNPKANWAQNARALRQYMSAGTPIRDASVDPLTGALLNNNGFLLAERELLRSRGWTYNPSTTLWSPP